MHIATQQQAFSLGAASPDGDVVGYTTERLVLPLGDRYVALYYVRVRHSLVGSQSDDLLLRVHDVVLS